MHAAGGPDVDANTKTICGVLPPDFGLYYQLIFIVFLNSVFNAFLGSLVYKIVVEPHMSQQQQHQKTSNINDKRKDTTNDDQEITDTRAIDVSPSATAVLFAFGIAIPCVVMEPIYAVKALGIRNVGLILTILATPINNILRITEALFGFTPVPAKWSLWNYVVYFSCSLGIDFDTDRMEETPKRVSREFFRKRLLVIGRDVLVISLLVSVLKNCEYEVFETSREVYSMDHTLQEIFSWQHLLNNFLVALLLSTSLSQGSLCAGILYNIVYGYQTYEIVLNPMLKSRSPSEFWGRRWNVLVHKGLKNGVYKPVRKQTSSKLLAIIATFVVSGIIHEYVNFVMFSYGVEPYEFKWKLILFFGWNGILIVLEYFIGHWAVFQWMSRNLPPIVLTVLVLCSALPLAHLFTGDWIRYGYFNAVSLSTPIIVCRRE